LPATLEPFDNKGTNTQTVKVESNLSDGWDYLNREAWMTVERGVGEDNNELVVSVERSYDLYPRYDTLIVYPAGDAFRSLTDSIPVVQAPALLMVQSSNTAVLNAPAEGGELIFTVYAKESWTVATDDTEERLILNGSVFSGTAEELEAGLNLEIDVAENISTEPVTYTITFSCGGEDYEYELIQAGAFMYNVL
jgi:hypothetical protein